MTYFLLWELNFNSRKILSLRSQNKAGCSAARLARHVRDVEVVSSNLTIPTLSVGQNEMV